MKKGEIMMAASSFGSNFKVSKEKVNEFVHEMKRKVPPTLNRDFHSRFVREKEIRPALLRAIGKEKK